MYGIIKIICRKHKTSGTVQRISIFFKPYSLMMQLDQKIMYLTLYFSAFRLLQSVVMNCSAVRIPFSLSSYFFTTFEGLFPSRSVCTVEQAHIGGGYQLVMVVKWQSNTQLSVSAETSTRVCGWDSPALHYPGKIRCLVRLC